jgi:GT2 family glycosyltransferase
MIGNERIVHERDSELMQPRVGIVLIGRNEGARLAGALDAALAEAPQVVYVDSGSSDNSVALAHTRGVAVIELDAVLPFSAARARNAGAAYWLEHAPALEFFLFADGDCELVPGFLDRALATLDRAANVGIVCGRVREQFPNASLYNHLFEIEWDTPIGEIKSCGGSAVVRVSAFCAVGGYAANWIAGEDPEFCLRVRHAGWVIRRIDAEMARHNARMIQFSQWWRRSTRAGHAYAQGAWQYRHDAEHLWLRESLSIWFWGAGVWSSAFLFATASKGASVALLLGYPALLTRIFLRARRRGLNRQDAALYALVCVVAKFPQLQGQILFLAHELIRQPTRLIEY